MKVIAMFKCGIERAYRFSKSEDGMRCEWCNRQRKTIKHLMSRCGGERLYEWNLEAAG